jgi:tRNA dimethylallyltransferase
MYFRVLTEGIADLPGADAQIREEIDAEAEVCGWPALHAQLAAVDAAAAARINPNDSQRIQRALEVYRVSGKSLSEWQAGTASGYSGNRFLKIAMVTESRAALHQRIALRLQNMLESGFVQEVETLMARPGLTAKHASMRAVGYRQIWSYLEGKGDLADASRKALAATRQLAKRQLTWLRSERQATVVEAIENDSLGTISTLLRGQLEG